MTETRVFLVRHGHTLADGRPARLVGWYDVPLSDVGRTQARLLGRWFRQLGPVPLVFASSSRRAVSTAEIMVAGTATPVRRRDDLREIHCGDLEGQPVTVVEREHPDVWRANLGQDDDQFRWPGGESYAEFRARCVAAVHEVAAGAGSLAVLVTHAGFISQIVGGLCGLPAAAWEHHRARNASVTEIAISAEELRLIAFDRVDHLARLTARL